MAMVLVGRYPFSEAQVTRLALERADVTVEIRGAMRSGLFGAEPLEDSLAEVWVEEAQRARAEQVLEELQRPAPEGSERACAKCGAMNPSHFQVCWQCQAQVVDGVPAEVAPEPEVTMPPAPAKPPTPFPKLTAALAVLVVALTAALVWVTQHPRRVERPGMQLVAEGNGCTREILNGVLRARFCDSDGDGRFERKFVYDREGRLYQSSVDDDADGFSDAVFVYDLKGRATATFRDIDHDGRLDLEDSPISEDVVYRTHVFVDGSQTLELVVKGEVQRSFVRTPRGWEPAEH